jgi:hypothetical protein
VFLLICGIDPIKIQALSYTHKYIQNTFPKVGLLEETKGGGKEGKRVMESE